MRRSLSGREREMADSERIGETAGTKEASSPVMSKRRRTVCSRNSQLPPGSLNSPTGLKCTPASDYNSCLCSSSDHFDDDRCCCRSSARNDDDDVDVNEKESLQRVDLEAPNSKTAGANSIEGIKFSEPKPSDEPCPKAAGEPAPADEPAPVNDGDKELGEGISLSEELEEFLANAERSEERQFTEKYNFDFVNDVPLEGRYEWFPLTP
ncbi:hypothetical protein FNV43_RR22475 [Rhamnella rubrinervis]|uniref:Cyclin-dependent kinase inhibitor n=1 Tax=Rhamnella rubrinervis TaxID=2594499 RepID=A0A8K0GS40_9ROSA|nr:hypothetical protein FNV43_RR22475 [Rhamnella rubrinervis]